jgi:hypothetical protein
MKGKIARKLSRQYRHSIPENYNITIHRKLHHCSRYITSIFNNKNMNARTQTGISEPGHPLKRLPSVAQ